MTSPKRSSRWPLAIVAVIALHAAGMVVVISIATRDPAFAVEPNHYQKALAWDAFAARARASQALGWVAKLRSDGPAAADHTRTLEVALSDRDGTPVTGARVAMLAFSHARGEDRIRVDLAEAAPGHYLAQVRLARAGVWEFRLVAERGSDSFTTSILHTVEGAP